MSLSLEAKQKPEKPLGEDGGRCPDVMLPPWSYKSELLTPKPKAYHHLPSEGHHPRQGDKHGINPLALHVAVMPVVGYHPGERVFILVYRLAIDAKTLRGDGGAG